MVWYSYVFQNFPVYCDPQLDRGNLIWEVCQKNFQEKKKKKHNRRTCLCEKSYLLSQSDNKKVQRQIQNRSLKKVRKLNICYQKQTSLENLSLKKKTNLHFASIYFKNSFIQLNLF